MSLDAVSDLAEDGELDDAAIDVAADLESGGEWPTPWGIEQRAAEVRGEWSKEELAQRLRLSGRTTVERHAKAELNADKVAEIESALLTAGRAIRSCRPELAEGFDAYAAFIDRLELAVRCPVGTLIGLMTFADKNDAVERAFRARSRESSAPEHRVVEALGDE